MGNPGRPRKDKNTKTAAQQIDVSETVRSELSRQRQSLKEQVASLDAVIAQRQALVSQIRAIDAIIGAEPSDDMFSAAQGDAADTDSLAN